LQKKAGKEGEEGALDESKRKKKEKSSKDKVRLSSFGRSMVFIMHAMLVGVYAYMFMCWGVSGD